MIQVDLAVDCPCRTGEGPLWHPDEQQLYWVDIPNGRLFRYDADSGEASIAFEGEPTGSFTVQADGALLLLQQSCAVSLWRGRGETRIIEELPAERETRFNDAIADPAGRVFAGTMGHAGAPSRLYRIETDGSVNLVLDDLGLANGMGFTPDRMHLYLTDTHRRSIYRFDYDQVTGELRNQQLFASVPDRDGEGEPDGLTVDAEGGVWSARWGGGCVVHYSPDGAEVERISVPVAQVSSVAFGGPDFGDLYITTAGGDDRSHHGDLAGSLFRCRPGINGLPEFRSQVLVDAGL